MVRVNCPNSTLFTVEISSKAFKLTSADETITPIIFNNDSSFEPYKRLQVDDSISYCLGPGTQSSGINNISGESAPTVDDVVACDIEN